MLSMEEWYGGTLLTWQIVGVAFDFVESSSLTAGRFENRYANRKAGRTFK